MTETVETAMRYRNKFTWKEISDPIYGYAYFNKEIEEDIINSLLIQRLRYILQLQTAHLVYPGAVHTRFQHSIGTMHLAGLMAEDIILKLKSFYDDSVFQGYKSETLIQAVRLAGLLHDAGHAAFGHAFEESLLWTRNDIPDPVANHEKIGALLIEILLEDKIRSYETHYGLDGLYDVLKALLGPETPREPILQIMRWLVKDSLYPSDILDFLRRDSYYTGTSEYGYINHERLVRNTYPYFEDGKALLLLDRNSWGEFRRYLYAKASMFEHVYYHSVNRAFDRLLKEILGLLDEELGLVDAVKKVAELDPYPYLMITDVKLYSAMLEHAVAKKDRLGRLCHKLLIERKPEWKRVGREYILTSYKGPQVLKPMLRLIFDQEERKRIASVLEDSLYERLSPKGVSRNDVWVDVLTISPIPKSTLIPGKETRGRGLLTLFMGKRTRHGIVKDRDINLIEEGIPLMVIFRAYIRRGLHRPGYEGLVTETLKETIEAELDIKDEFTETAKKIYETIKSEELEKQRITM